MNQDDKIKTIKRRTEYCIFSGIFIATISFIFANVVHMDGDYEKVIWLWSCVIGTGVSLVSFGVRVGIYICLKLLSDEG